MEYDLENCVGTLYKYKPFANFYQLLFADANVSTVPMVST